MKRCHDGWESRLLAKQAREGRPKPRADLPDSKEDVLKEESKVMDQLPNVLLKEDQINHSVEEISRENSNLENSECIDREDELERGKEKYPPDLLSFFERKQEKESPKSNASNSEKSGSSNQQNGKAGSSKLNSKYSGNKQENRKVILGKVKFIHLEKKYGFISPGEDGNIDSGKQKDVWFHFDKVRSYLFKLKKDDEVEFSLYQNKDKKISAVNIMLLKPAQRSLEDISDYLAELHSEIEHEDGGTTTIAQIIAAPHIWQHVSYMISVDHRNADLLYKFVTIIIQLEGIVKSFGENFKRMLAAITNVPQFFNPFRGYLKKVIEGSKDEDVKLLQKFLFLIIKYVPDKTHAVIALSKPLVNRGIPITVTFLFDMLKAVAKLSGGNIDDMEWKNLPHIITNEEIHSPSISDYMYLQGVKRKGPYTSADDYIETYFRLLRADCFSSLKNGIKDYLNDKLDPRDMSVYINVMLYGIEAAKNCIYLALKITPIRKIKNWEKCSNLMFGNLICLSIGGNFSNVVWATVADRKLLQSDSIVMVQTCSEFNVISDSETIIDILSTPAPVIMVESPTYYRAYQPILQALQSIDPEDISFRDELVFLNNKRDPFFKLDDCFPSELVYKDTSGDIPISDFLSYKYDPINSIFDKSQEKAVKDALLSNIGIIQGPPGTGKSFIGVQLLRILLSMSSLKSPKALILTYKNHALDEFVKSAEKYFPSEIVRIGGRSSDPDLEKISLRNVLREEKKNFDFIDQIRTLEHEISLLKDDIEDLFEKLSGSRYFTYGEIYNKFSAEQKINLIKYCNWENCNISSYNLDANREGYAQQKKKKKKNKITSKEVEIILKNVNQHEDKVINLLHAAFLQWLPAEREFLRADLKLKGLEESKISFAPQDSKPSNKDIDDTIEVDNLEIIEKQEERYANFTMKSQAKSRITRVSSCKSKERISSFSSGSTKHLLQGDSNKLLHYESIWKLEVAQRIFLVEYIIAMSRKEIISEFEEKLQVFDEKVKQLNEVNNQCTSQVLKSKSVIAMTITGAAINHMLLKEIQPEIVIVEEAAEILEPQLIAAIGSWTKYMLLVGDQYQLRPSVETYELKRDFSFDISMMERLIDNNMKFAALEMQNRQRDEFARLLQDIYPSLKTNKKRVEGNEPAKCLEKSFFFWDHDFPENAGGKSVAVAGEASRSVTNSAEAERAVMLALFLVQQGYNPEKITIISMYQGQTSLIRKCLKEAIDKYESVAVKNSGKTLSVANEEGKQIIVHTVDMYQGDENDFVIVSLVRSNKEKKIGFLKERNRRCVAQSRAKCGVYFIGNADMFFNHPTWRPMMEMLGKDNRIGRFLTVKCEYHPNLVVPLENLTFKPFCHEPCILPMNCGIHKCEKVCQPFHAHNVCKKVINFTHTACGHNDSRKCHEDLSSKKCLTEVPFRFPRCKHPGKKKCYEDMYTIICSYMVTVKLNCGHSQVKTCFASQSSLNCKEKCSSMMSCGIHPCSSNCQPPHSHNTCNEPMMFTYVTCGHKDRRKCMEDPETKKCESEVTFIFPNCRHEGKKSCHVDISTLKCSFKEMVPSKCGHLIKKKCFENINDKQCNEECQQGMSCGHPCDHKCFQHELIKECKVCIEMNEIKAEKQRGKENEMKKKQFEQIDLEISKLRRMIVTRGEVDKEELKPEGPTASEYFDVEDYVKKYIQPTHAWFPIVRHIYRVTNNYLKIKWLDAKRTMYDPEFRSALKFHGTSDESIDSIIKNGFILPSSNRNSMYGAGIYFASDSSKSAQKMYTKGSNKLLLCDVLLGKPFTVEKGCADMNLGKLKEKQFDSLFAKRGTRETGGVLYDEFVVYNPHQAYPKYIIHYGERPCAALPTNTKLQFLGSFQTGRKEILPKRGMKLDDVLDNHFRTAESQFLRLLINMRNMGVQNNYKVQKVEVYMNETLRRNFEKNVNAFELKYGNSRESEILFGFHGTRSRPIVEDIMNNNFKRSTTGKFGAGVYFSEMPTYTFGYGGTSHLILAKILPGKIFPCQSSGMGSAGLRPGFDSHGGIPLNDGSGRYNEIVIFNTDQILPCYVIHIQ